MIAFDLRCADRNHQFEGWFASSVEFEKQKAASLLCCPICGSSDVMKAIMAPNIAKKSNQRASEATASTHQAAPVSNMDAMPEEMIAAIQKVAAIQSSILEKSEYVGPDFAEEARAIHYGESEQRVIHGEASPTDAEALHEEGIAISALPLPYIPPQAKN